MASTDTFKPSPINHHKLLDLLMGSAFTPRSSSGAFHSHSPFSIEDFDIFNTPDALSPFFEQEALLVDAPSLCVTHTPPDVQNMALSPLSPTWSLDELCNQDGAQDTSSPASTSTCMQQHSPSVSQVESDIRQQREAPHLSSHSSLPAARDRFEKAHPFSRFRSVKNVYKHANFVDGHAANGKNDHTGKKSASKNIITERKRRRKLNDRLYSLRALVPKISKMDKASIVNDAIDHVRNLQNLVKDMEDEILTLRTRASGAVEEPLHCAKGGLVLATSRRLKAVDHKILKVDVFKMEETTYHLRILCIRGSGVFVKLARALEALQFEIVNANLTSINDRILHTIFMKAKNGRTMESRDLREMILEVATKFGLGLAREG